MSRKENERTKLIQEKCQTLLTQMLRDEDNKYCVDCDAKGPRWASWNLGVFLCIRCAGIHRNLGVHISRVKSVNLDTWTPEQVISLQQMGNSRARAVYEAQLPDGFRRPQTDTALESFIRAKYEHKKYLAREWVPPQPPKVDWAKEIDEELERQKRKKKAAQACTALGLSVISSTASSATGGSGLDKKTAARAAASAKATQLPAPLPKPKPGQSGSSPKTQRHSTSSAHDHSNDLLGLASPTKPQLQAGGCAPQDLHNDSFSGFLSAPAAAAAAPTNHAASSKQSEHQQTSAHQAPNSLAKEEEDFFNQGSLGSMAGGGVKDKSGKLTKDSILALYGTAPTTASAALTNSQCNVAQMQYGQPQAQTMFATTNAYGGMNYMGGIASGGGMPPSQQQQQQQPHQFMTPPNSTSMYNTPVMTAPTAFTTGGMHMAGAGTAGGAGGFGAQFPMQNMSAASFSPQMGGMLGGGGGAGVGVGGMMMAGGSGIMATGQQPPSLNINLMQPNQQGLLSIANPGGGGVMGMQHTQMGAGGAGGMSSMAPMPMTGMQSASIMAASFQAPNAAANTSNLNQQFGNLNIGNVWQ